MDYTVPLLSVVFMVFSAVMGVVIPIVLLLVIRKKYKADISSFFIGCGVFIVFAIILEGIANFLLFNSAIGKSIRENIWLYGIIGGLQAGIYEETGRFTAFKTIMKKKLDNDINAVMYGAGHGGFEVLFILVVGMFSNIVTSIMLNAGMGEMLTKGVTDPQVLETLNNSFAALSTTPSGMFLMGIVERLGAVAFHMSASVLVWFAAKNKKLFWLYPLAILLHTLINAVSVISSKYVPSLWIVMAILYVMAAGCIMLARTVWKKNTQTE